MARLIHPDRAVDGLAERFGQGAAGYEAGGEVGRSEPSTIAATADEGPAPIPAPCAASFPNMIRPWHRRRKRHQAQVAGLRKLLEEDAALLSTVRGLGYRLTLVPRSAGSASTLAQEIPMAGQVRRLPEPRFLLVIALLFVAGLVAVFWTVRETRLKNDVWPDEVAVLPFP